MKYSRGGSVSHPFEDLIKGIAHQPSCHSRIKQLFFFHYQVKLMVQFPPRTAEVPNPERNEFHPSSLPLACSIRHQQKTKMPPKVANPLAVPFIFLQSFLSTIAVDLLTFPIQISLISTAFMNMAMTSPIAPPSPYETAALPIQFPQSAPRGKTSDSMINYYKDS